MTSWVSKRIYWPVWMFYSFTRLRKIVCYAHYSFAMVSDCSTVIEGEPVAYQAETDFIKKIRGNADEAVEIEEHLSLNVLWLYSYYISTFVLVHYSVNSCGEVRQSE